MLVKQTPLPPNPPTPNTQGRLDTPSHPCSSPLSSALHLISAASVICVAFRGGVTLPVRRAQSSSKRTISRDDWARKLQAVKLRKEDMNRLVMNFLVTEVRRGLSGSASKGVQAFSVLPAGTSTAGWPHRRGVRPSTLRGSVL